MQTHLSYHLQRIVMPKRTITDKRDDLEGLANLLQQPLDVCVDTTPRRTEGHLATMTILAAFGAPSRATGLLLRRRLTRGLAGLLNLFGHYWVRGATLDAEQG
jgi:hypothetical protein